MYMYAGISAVNQVIIIIMRILIFKFSSIMVFIHGSIDNKVQTYQ